MRELYETFPLSSSRLSMAPTFADYVEDVVLAADTLLLALRGECRGRGSARGGAGRELGMGEGREAVWTWRVGRAVVTMIFIII